MRSDLSDCAQMLQRKSRGVERMGLGTVADGHVLVDALGVGDKPRRVLACDYFLADIGVRKSTRHNAVDCIRLALGRGCADQYFTRYVSAGIRIVAVVPPMESREAIFGRYGVGGNFLFRDNRALAGAKLRSLRQVHFYSIKFWRRTPARQWAGCGWDVDVLSA